MLADSVSVLADTSGVLALLDKSDPAHEAAKTYLQTLIVPSTILCEVDYLASKRFGSLSARRFLASLISGRVAFLNAELRDLELTYQLMERYADAEIGFVDASLIALAEHHGIRRVLTLDRRHFHFVAAPSLGYLELLP
jgi:predicted nucleic acid-binding protein